MMSMGGFVLALARGTRFEPAPQGRNQITPAAITIDSTSAHPQAVAGIGRPFDTSVEDIDDPGGDRTWRTTYDKLVSAKAPLAGGISPGRGVMDANGVFYGG